MAEKRKKLLKKKDDQAKKPNQPKPEDERMLDETIRQSFPASDPPSRTPIVGH